MTGQCDRGCDAGWTGIICNKGTEKIIKIKHQKKWIWNINRLVSLK